MPRATSRHHKHDALVPASVPAAPVESQTTARISADLHQRLRIIAALENESLMSLIEAVLTQFVKNYNNLAQSALPDIESLPTAQWDCATFRLSKNLRDAMRSIAKSERITLLRLTEGVLLQFTYRYEKISKINLRKHA